MIDAPLALAFTAGMVAVVNPCGFPMLPAYLSWFIGIDDERADPEGRVPRALASGASVSAGFLLVFAVLGIPINAGATSIYRWMPPLTIVVGAVLVLVGLSMLAGWRLKVALPHLDRGGRDRGVASMVLFGASYAVASLSCTLPVMLVYVFSAPDDFLSGLVAFGAYGAGTVVVLLAVSLALALARESLVRRLRAALRYVDRVAAVLLVLVGGYLIWYGVHALDRDNLADNPFGFVESWSADASAWLADGGTQLGLFLAVAVVAALLWTLRRAR